MRASTTRATGRRLGGELDGCLDVDSLLHILYWAIKSKSCQGQPMSFSGNVKSFLVRLTAFQSPCIIEIVGLPGSVFVVPRSCLDRGIKIHASSPRIPLLLLPCRLSDSRAASWECRAHAILADPHRLNLRNPGPRASVSWAFSLGNPPALRFRKRAASR